MYMPNKTAALNAYQEVGVRSGLDEANPHRLIQMLMEGVLDRVARAKGHMSRGEISPKGEQISRAISILEGLRLSLDPAQSEELAERLEQLYDYMGRRLAEANLHNDVDRLDEVLRLMKELKAGWDGIPAEAVEEAIARRQSDTESGE
ncbi:flagellar export chaperone FliS [Natronospira bacteriovora]|uniref:Flagellar secretion chaperone FliS n=1 Tax=Natronospira bacteriovora TaxID=3069753 RepID=A0ABU0W3F7_9GAMM|nr:flagellar export chaperone FliS [Natronospira sp. AB-CW4]MDQ2068481.1 flagellar export chaperone FliS [Natronospira sp. AB-CW4]